MAEGKHTVAKISRILTIEDESAVRSGIVAYLEDSGFEILEAGDGVAGVDLFRREQPDVVLCDLRLPGMDGLEVLSTITDEAPETPVIVVSGASRLGYAVQALKRGAWDYVTKPIEDMAVLETAVRRVLERAELMRQNRAYREHLESLNRELTRTLKKLEEDETAGRNVQFRLLPKDGREFGAYRFSRRLFPSMYLSGDFVDYFAIDERRVGFYIADVSGHGAASAFVTVMLKTLVEQYREAFWQESDDTILHPSRVLQRLNRDLCRQRIDRHVTMFFGMLDSEQSVMQCSSAAQFPYPVLWHGGGGARYLPCPSRPVGLFEDSLFTVKPIELPRGFKLLLVSDGVFELLPGVTLRDKQDALLGYMDKDDAGLDGLVATLGLENGRRLPDDVTLLMVQGNE